MKRRYGLGHYQRPPFQRKPVPASLRRLGIALLIGAGVAIVAAWPAPAQPVTCNQLGCSDNPGVKRKAKQSRSFSARRHDASGNVVGGRPRGCPRKFCGCEASLYVFGKIKPMLNLANNWRVMFPRTSPAPGMVAARPGHVFVLMSHVSGSRWLVHDGNSGGGLTREHVRSIRGYTIVNPHGSKMAEK